MFPEVPGGSRQSRAAKEQITGGLDQLQGRIPEDARDHKGLETQQFRDWRGKSCRICN